MWGQPPSAVRRAKPGWLRIGSGTALPAPQAGQDRQRSFAPRTAEGGCPHMSYKQGQRRNQRWPSPRLLVPYRPLWCSCFGALCLGGGLDLCCGGGLDWCCGAGGKCSPADGFDAAVAVLLVSRVGGRYRGSGCRPSPVLRVIRRAVGRIRFRERPESTFRIALVRRRRIHPRLFRRHGRRVIFPARGAGRNRGMSAEIAGPGGGRDRRASMIFRGEVLAILAGQVLVLGLRRQRSGVLLVCGRFFLRRRTRLNSALPAVVAHVRVLFTTTVWL